MTQRQHEAFQAWFTEQAKYCVFELGERALVREWAWAAWNAGQAYDERQPANPLTMETPKRG